MVFESLILFFKTMFGDRNLGQCVKFRSLYELCDIWPELDAQTHIPVTFGVLKKNLTILAMFSLYFRVKMGYIYIIPVTFGVPINHNILSIFFLIFLNFKVKMGYIQQVGIMCRQVFYMSIYIKKHKRKQHRCQKVVS